MKRNAGYWIIAAAAVLILALVAGPLLANDEGDKTMQNNGAIPPLDTNLPEVTETATFSLG
jgi:hypothetical protein